MKSHQESVLSGKIRSRNRDVQAVSLVLRENSRVFIFDHVGITTTQPRPGENWVEQSKIWVTNPHQHPEHIEFLRYREDSTVPAVIRDHPHIAYRVESFEPLLQGVEILIPPFPVGDFLEVVFVKKYGVIFEYMRYLKDGWFDA